VCLRTEKGEWEQNLPRRGPLRGGEGRRDLVKGGEGGEEKFPQGPLAIVVTQRDKGPNTARSSSTRRGTRE